MAMVMQAQEKRLLFTHNITYENEIVVKEMIHIILLRIMTLLLPLKCLISAFI